MKTNRIMTLVLAAAVLAVITSGSAFAMTPGAQLSSGPSAEWTTQPSNSFTVAKGGTFSETCTWKQNLNTPYQLDGIYCYSSIYTAQQYNQVNYPYILSYNGQVVTKTTSVTASNTNTGSNKDYNLCLGFWVNDPQLHNYFTSTVTEKITVY